MKQQKLDLREMTNPDCVRCQREVRKRNVSNEVCTIVNSVLDGLTVRCVGEWSYDKIYRLVQYFGIFSRGMKNKWAGLNYIEICSGPGRCVTRSDCNEMDGTSLAIINHKVFPELKKAVFIDIDPSVVDTLNKRIKSLDATQQAKAFVGDYNDIKGMMGIIKNLQTNYLNLICIDPTECDVPFETISAIAQYLRSADIIINIALGT
ncbi:MAG: three-Cys-motif partner protein TcmP, partial [Desulfobacteraceae bacterium]|nr:three-Cys-motif partner protein TcmP [Desulfobacteraceae bacterium]